MTETDAKLLGRIDPGPLIFIFQNANTSTFQPISLYGFIYISLCCYGDKTP